MRPLAALLCLFAAGLPFPAPGASRDLAIVATIPPYAMLARAVAGEAGKVHTLVRRGQDPHHYEPGVADMARLHRARVVVANGLGRQRVEDLLDQVPSPARIFRVAEEVGFAPIRDERGAVNGHIWLDPDIMSAAAGALARRLGGIRPAARERFAANARDFVRAVAAADGDCRTWLADLPTRKVVTFHPAFDYFFRHYRLTVAGTYLDLAGGEPSPREVQGLIETLRAEGIPAVFREPQLPEGPVRALAAEAGARVGVLDPLGFAESITDYPALLRLNAQRIRDAYRP